ncbi:hypothetical protein AN214_04023 [Pseudoalteromonas sp. P1-9]|uniref:hypothetical protein n=1 Tax=Pseudoalteromonas sp. P1-9 TaxID=1710354 RepID=UPI0006D6394E|nr:hypothetical protein [Pseudoalteromonas sp. P1-9]KPV93924.1 hypothetical protein AN214_04023 [Pseudoalteromonas sp. P1-9]
MQINKIATELNVLLFLANIVCTWLVVGSAFGEVCNLPFYESTFFIAYNGPFLVFLPFMIAITYALALFVISNFLVLVVAKILNFGLISNGAYFAFEVRDQAIKNNSFYR